MNNEVKATGSDFEVKHPITTKKCGRTNPKTHAVHQVFPITEFYASGQTKDGYQCFCKACMTEQIKSWHERNWARYDTPERKEKNRLELKAWYANPENKEKHKKAVVEYNKNKMKTDVLYRIRQNLLNIVNAKKRYNIDKTKLNFTKEQFLEKLGDEAERMWAKEISPRIDQVVPLQWFVPGTPVVVLYNLDNITLTDMSLPKNSDRPYPLYVTAQLYKAIRPFIEIGRKHLLMVKP